MGKTTERIESMKKLILISLLLLNGCALWMAPYDNNEYALVNKVRTISQLGDCTKKNIDSMYFTALELKNYSEMLPRNDQTIALTKDLFTVVEEMKKRTDFSSVYCKAKLNIIEISAEKIQHAIGNKPR
jgi:PBP1b-binding outer membrane lipoprotein LpoB